MHAQRHWIGTMALFSFVISSAISLPAFGGDVLTEVLREKGVISKEDWIRIEADREKTAAATQGTKTKKKSKDKPAIPIWTKKGFGFKTEDGNWATRIQWRSQLRFTTPERDDPDTSSDFTDKAEHTFELRRVRIKVGGHGFKPWVTYYMEIDWQGSSNSGTAAGNTRVLDWRITLEKYKALQIRLGQWKINYNRERVDSSGKQTMVERSISNSVFTIDRQMGILVMGRLFPGKAYDMNYYAGIFNGSGRGEANDDDQLMYMARLQWNIFGRKLKWEQIDIKYHKNPAATLGIGGYTNVGKCTRWSSSGCGTLVQNTSLGNSFTSDSSAAVGQFKTEGIMQEFALKYRGLNIQEEVHWKQVKDNGPAGTGQSKTNLMGGYVVGSYFPHHIAPAIPKPLNIAYRYSWVDPNVFSSNDELREHTFGVNWLFAGHRNKLTADVTHMELEQSSGNPLTEQRVRVQWDVSF